MRIPWCEGQGKWSYPSAADCHSARERATRRQGRRRAAPKGQVYQCSQCHGWHMSRNSKGKTR